MIGVSVELESYDGRIFRWSPVESETRNRAFQTGFGTQRGDGFAQASCVVNRRADLDYDDLRLLYKGRFIGADGSIAYDGRVVGMPRTIDAEGSRIAVQLQGLMATARDRPFTEVYVDRAGSNWGTPSLALRSAINTAGALLDADYTASADDSAISFGGNTDKNIPVGSQADLVYRMPDDLKASSVQYNGTEANITNEEAAKLFAADSDSGEMGTWDSYAITLDGTLRTATLATARALLGLRLRRSTAGTPTSAANRILSRIAVYGSSGITLRSNGSNPQGVYASDAMRDIIDRFCPYLNADGVEATNYVLSHLVFGSPTFPFDAFTLLNGYHLWELGAWEGGKVIFAPADLTTYDWQVRTDDPGVTLDLQGTTTDSFANGIVVTYTDVDGYAHVLWPSDHTELADANPNNPANRAGIELWTSLSLSNPVVQADALQIGAAALADFNRPKSPGTINVAGGFIRDAQGNPQPSWKVRASQTIAVTNLSNDDPRLITQTSWQEDGSLQITLEQPSSRADAALARLALAQQAIGFS